jgi:hypothetical protein
MKRCIVCGARARGITCGGSCTRARKAGVSRENQLRREMDEKDWSFREFDLRRRGYRRATASTFRAG